VAQELEPYGEPELEKIRMSLQRAIPLLEAGARGSLEKRGHCFTCHNQGYPLLALRAARDRGWKIDEAEFQRQTRHVAEFLEKNRERFLEGKGTGGEVATAGNALWALASADYPANETTAAVTQYLLGFRPEKSFWQMTSDRPPSEHADVTATYLAIRGLTRYATEPQRVRRDERFAQVRTWLKTFTPTETEEHVYRLWCWHALSDANADPVPESVPESVPEPVRQATQQLLDLQQTDGGWAQKPGMATDAYATATALVVLHEAGGLAVTDQRYRRGVQALLESQQPDGSWHVVSRSKPFQTYFESGFPHGKDQFISITASAWAVLALARTCPVVERDR
jgi:N-acyl-D-amino-acid deacylase